MVSMPQNWIVIGAGRQGPAVAYDLAKFGNPDALVLADSDLELATKASDQVNSLLRSTVVKPMALDLTDESALREALSERSLAVAAAPYHLNPLVSLAGIDVGCNVVDMGVDTPDALDVHKRDDEARTKGVSIVTDCGVAPGLVNILARKLIDDNPTASSVRLYCGGLPESAEPPFFHRVGFSVESLLGEYVDDVYSLRDGKVVSHEALDGLETLDFGALGTFEAASTSGGTGTAPYNLPGRIENYEYKTLRYPGHWGAMLFMRDAGLWSEETLDCGVSPRAVTLELMARKMVRADDRDIVVTRVMVTGPDGTKGYDVIDRFDPETGFTGMQRTTGFSTAIVAHAVASGQVRTGCMACESAIDPDTFFVQAKRRGISLAEC